jgi:hypothetical protein
LLDVGNAEIPPDAQQALRGVDGIIRVRVIA